MTKNEKEFITRLRITGREGIEELIKHMQEIGFFKAPASTSNHLYEEGGLLVHTLNVMRAADRLAEAWGAKVPDESITIAAALHDLGKCGDHGKKEYVPNYLKSGNVSGSKPWKRNKDLLNVPHEVRSVAITNRFIDLTEEEEHAILYHNGLYGSLRYEIQGNETPLYMIVHFADMWASRVIEGK